MKQELDLLGYEVTVAKNGQEAVELASLELPDLIIPLPASQPEVMVDKTGFL